MLLWVGFIGKLIDLIITKVVGKQVDLKLDDRKRAARAFLGLHDSLTTLSGIAYEFLSCTQPVVDGTQPRLYKAKLSKLAVRADSESRSFVAALNRLNRIIEIYDSQLGLLLRGIASGKEALLSFSGDTSLFTSKMKFELIPNPESVFAIRYSAPTEALMDANLEESYAAASNIAEKLGLGKPAIFHPLSIEWPEDMLLSLVEKGSVEGRIPDNSVAQIRELHEIVSRYASLFAASREQLSVFIRKTFAIEDLL